MRQPLGANVVAFLLTLAYHRLRSVRGKELTRIKISRRSLCRVAARVSIRDAFFESLQDECLEYGLVLLRSGEFYAMIDQDAVERWPSIASKLVSDASKALRDIESQQERVALLQAFEHEIPEKSTPDED
jgi:hypothetical protein